MNTEIEQRLKIVVADILFITHLVLKIESSEEQEKQKKSIVDALSKSIEVFDAFTK